MWPFNIIRNLRRKVSYLESVVKEQGAELRLCQARPYFTEISRDLEPQVARAVMERALDMAADKLAVSWEPLLSDGMFDALQQLVLACRGANRRVPRYDPHMSVAHENGNIDTVLAQITVPSVTVEVGVLFR